MENSSIKAVVVLSGGQDSALCLALAVRRHGADAVAAITFRYGQRHAVETRFARRLAKRFGAARHIVVGMDFYRRLTTNALLDPGIAIARPRGATCPTTVVEGRNAFFAKLKVFPTLQHKGAKTEPVPFIRTGKDFLRQEAVP